jgi:hypothetical protein
MWTFLCLGDLWRPALGNTPENGGVALDLTGEFLLAILKFGQSFLCTIHALHLPDDPELKRGGDRHEPEHGVNENLS